MRNVVLAIFFLTMVSLVALAQAPSPSTPAAVPPKPAATPAVPSFDLTAMDKTIDPCVDFYKYACGGWMAKNPVPPDQARWGRFDELQERNRDILHDILDKAAAPNPKRSAVLQKIGDYYASCMDESRANALGAKPLEPELKQVAAIASKQEMINTIAHLQLQGVSVLFNFYPRPDLHSASDMIAFVDQGGLGLPDRDYYLKDDAKSAETRAKYLEHMQKMFELAGDKPEQASSEAKAVMSIETALAKASMDRTERRVPKNLDHKMTTQELQALAPNFDFPQFFSEVNAPSFTALNVTVPEFFKQVNAQIADVPLADWKTYLRWHVVHEMAPVLSNSFVDENFRFYQQYLGGQKELQPRWKRCVRLTDDELGEALGQPYVDQTFGVEGKQRTLKMVQAIEQSMGEDLKQLPWMTQTTKERAEQKLGMVENKIGYPDKWRDYSKVNIVRDDFVGNTLRAENFESARQVNKISKPVDKTEWGMTPPTVNAYYNPSQNNINFPAGILQPPFYDNNKDDAVNFGAIGSVIGHELTHGFDDAGSRYDGKGDLRDWWTAEDNAEFQKRTGCVADEYSQFVAVDDVHLNGKLTLGENTADNGGVRLSYMSLERQLKEKPVSPIDGFTPEQRFFISYAQVWCQNVTPEQSLLRAKTDPHSPGQYRVKGVVGNMPEFQQAFHCRPDQPMVRENACRVW